MPNQNLTTSETVESLLEEMIGMQRDKVLKIAERLVPNITTDDVLSPVDVPELARDPIFNFEDGVLAGLLQAQMGLRVSLRNVSDQPKSTEAKD